MVRLYDKILADIRTNGDAENHIVFLGDYMDRGPDGFGVLDFLASRENKDGLWHEFLFGNHEDLFVAATTIDWAARPKPKVDTLAVECWLENGGWACVHEMGFETYKDFAYDGKYEKYVDWLTKKTQYYFETEDYVFVHAGLDIRKPMAEQDEQVMMWARYKQLNWYQSYPKMVIHGHTPNKEPKFDKNRINVDTSMRKLTAVALPNRRNDAEIRFLEVK